MSRRSILAESKNAERWFAVLLGGKRLLSGTPGHQLDVHFGEDAGMEVKHRAVPKLWKDAMAQADAAEPQCGRSLRVVGLFDKPGHGGVAADHYVLLKAEDFRDLYEAVQP